MFRCADVYIGSHVHISSECKLAGVILLIQMFSYSTALYANTHTHFLPLDVWHVWLIRYRHPQRPHKPEIRDPLTLELAEDR